MKGILALLFALATCSLFGAINAVNGVTASTSSNINGVASPSAVNGQSLVSGGSFNPQTQGTLVAWYDASTLGLANGASVTTFTDSKTGSPYSLIGNGLTVPVYATAQQNGLGTVFFNGTSNGFAGGGSSATTFPYTIAAVVKVADTSAAYTIMGARGSSGGLQFRLNTTTGFPRINKSNVAAIGTATSAPGTGAYHLIVVTVDSSNYAFYIDGVASGSGSHSETLTGTQLFEMGVNRTTGSYDEWFSGYIAEVQIYSSVLSSGDLTGLHTYIVNKWATP